MAQYAGDLVAVGEVENVGTSIINNIGILGTAYNSTGGVLGSTNFPAFAADLLPGQISPFYLDFLPVYSVTPQDPTWVNNVTSVTCSVTNLSDVSTTPYTGLAVESGSTGTDSGGTYTVQGTIVNNGSETVGNVWVLSTFYNSNNTVVGIGVSNYAATSLSPGDSTPFTASPTDNTAEMSGEIANYSVLVQYDPYVVATPTPITSTSSPTPTSSSRTTATPTQSTAPISLPLTFIYLAIGAVVAVVAVLVALMMISKRSKTAKLQTSPPPPPPPPPT
jgi:hypothetical protein